MPSLLSSLRKQTSTTQQKIKHLHQWLKGECLESARLDDFLNQWDDILEDIFYFFESQIEECISSNEAWKENELDREELYENFLTLGDELNIEDEIENLFTMREIEKSAIHAKKITEISLKEFNILREKILSNISILIETVCSIVEFDET